MNTKINTICVFASSSNNIDKIYFDEAYKLGSLIAKNCYNIVYGGSNLGLMGEVVQAAHAYGSEITGVMPQKLYDLGINPGNCSKFILTKGMRERKAKMDELSQAVITLPGGFGTIEELSEMLTQKQLAYSNKPIVILNTNNYYGDLIKFYQKVILERFAPAVSSKLFYVANTSMEAIEYINNYKFEDINYIDKKIQLK